jgi:hypothetical protein
MVENLRDNQDQHRKHNIKKIRNLDLKRGNGREQNI